MAALKKIGTYARNTVLGLGMAAGLHMCGMMGTQVTANALSENIGSQSRLEEVVKEERKNLDCGNKRIRAVLTKGTDAFSQKRKNDYLIRVGGKMATRTMVRHELYHVCDDYLEHTDSKLYYLFVAEPTAILYQAFGLKL